MTLGLMVGNLIGILLFGTNHVFGRSILTVFELAICYILLAGFDTYEDKHLTNHKV